MDMGQAPETISFSALNQYNTCSWQYKLERVDKVPVPPAWFFMGGTAVHVATARLDERNSYPYPDDEVEYIWTEAFDQEIALAYEEWPDDTQWRKAGYPNATWPEGYGYNYWDERGLKAVRAWESWMMYQDSLISVVNVEEEISEALPSGIILKGFIDRVVLDPHGDFAVLDIKTGTKRPESPLQLAFYAVGLDLKHRFDPSLPGKLAKYGYWWMAKDGKEFPVRIDHMGLEWINVLSLAYAKAVENEIFIPNPGKICDSCPFTRMCPAHPDSKKEGAS